MSPIVETEPTVLRVDGGGTIRVGSSRVTLDTLVAVFDAGATPEQIVQDFPTLELGDVYAAIGYYLRHREELASYLEGRSSAAMEYRKAHPHLYANGVREKLLSRRGTP